MKTQVILTKTKQVKKPNTKTVWLTESVETEEVTLSQHNKATNDGTLKWFRRLGGSETVTRSYTCVGYLPTKVVSTGPDKQERTIREYEFKINR